eukprot:m.679202 g.679202  ORF g.679202 m.679202 type:complete len:293 (-) comp58582_c0_seq30:20-898(-)
MCFFSIRVGCYLQDAPQYGQTCLHHAARLGGQELLEFFLASGSFNINEQNEDGLTPAMLAARWGSLECLRSLAQAGADVTFRAEDGRTILHLAAGAHAPKVIRFLLEPCAADINVQDENGMTVLMLLVRNDDPMSRFHLATFTECHRLEIVEKLLALGADVNLMSDEDETAKDIASRGRFPEIVRRLQAHEDSLAKLGPKNNPAMSTSGLPASTNASTEPGFAKETSLGLDEGTCTEAEQLDSPDSNAEQSSEPHAAATAGGTVSPPVPCCAGCFWEFEFYVTIMFASLLPD